MKRLQIHGLRKAFGVTRALEFVNVALEAGEIHAVLGESGAGKSTLAGILGGVLCPDGGSVLLDGVEYAPQNPRAAHKAGVSLVGQSNVLAPALSVEENLMLGCEPHRAGWIRRDLRRATAGEALQSLCITDVSLDARVASLSTAARRRVEIARALASRPKLLVLDEPFSALEAADKHRLLAMLGEIAERGVSILYIGGSIDEARAFAHRYSVLRNGRTVAEGAMKELSRAALVQLMAGRETGFIYPRFSHYCGRTLLRVSALTADSGPRSVNLALREGEIFGLAGIAGAGRRSLLKVLSGVEPVRSGEIVLAGRRLASAGPATRLRAGIAMVGKERTNDDLFLNRTVAENLALTRLAEFGTFGFISNCRWRTSVADWLEKLRVRSRAFGQPVARLSRGERKKIAIGRLIHHRARVLLMDEPTAGLDQKTRMEIYGWFGELVSEGKSILVTAPYIPELLGMCDTIGVMRGGCLVEVRPAEAWTEPEILRIAAGVVT